ncbi:hypothetical protein BHECKSOX_112 [Bathymodiolus heckerae thiotrophic gill symbiont]|uniref:DUF2141 domain-containing protein n=1 Tax=Bathymodiolus heckerae thiotrophic gill symbiont TaxID=1052212 RepID=UPI0010BC8144|nr:DUF2141 domain-containing protein [Bathymodiolus heckerae thiotrophic gill symbiont]SHN93369.1 hypothetical protein BHECKSOX_112 [Bathymodiolus heckerae thiotrophic gill symbiont]
MKYIIYYFSLILLSTNTIADSLKINIHGITLNQGNVRIGIFNRQEFPNGNQFEGVIVNSDKNKLSKTLQIPSGSYAIAIFQDTNNNKVLDKNFFGIPIEKYGFSGADVFGEPTFDEAKIIINGDQTISVKID